MPTDPTNPDVPPSLVRSLQGAYGTPIHVEPRVDAAISAIALERAAIAVHRGAARRRALMWGGGLAAAAGLALGVFIAVRPATPPAPSALAIAEDINGDGTVDILDAFALHRAIAGNGSRLVDVNGDGAVDRVDVDRIALRAVRLGDGGNG